jgi:hypothetical protein
MARNSHAQKAQVTFEHVNCWYGWREIVNAQILSNVGLERHKVPNFQMHRGENTGILF